MTPSILRVQSFAKINLALAVLGKRADGFHEIQTVLQTIDLCDELEIRPASGLHLQCLGLDGVATEQNLVWKAARLLSSGAEERGAELLLRKRIPAGAGLGGGSSNAAATLMALARFWRLETSVEELSQLASSLGSDVSFFLHGGTAFAHGRGEQIRPLPDLSSMPLVVIFPGLPIRTAEAYQSLRSGLTSEGKIHRIQRFCGRIPEGPGVVAEGFNDFEASILPAYPAVKEAHDFLNRQGATATLLSGSGSSVFGFFLEEESALAASRAAVPVGWRVFPAKTLSRAEYFQRLFG